MLISNLAKCTSGIPWGAFLVFFADGFLGQRTYIIPSKKLVVLRMGYSMSNFRMNDFLRDIIANLPG